MKQPKLIKGDLKKEITVRDWKNIDKVELGRVLLESAPSLPANVEKATATYTNWIESACRTQAPVKKFTPRRAAPSAPWFSGKLQESKSECKKLERSWRKGYSPQDKAAYKASLILYKQALLEAKRSYFSDMILKAKSSSSELFKTIQKLTIPSKPTTTGSPEFCETLASFLKKVQDIFSSFSYRSHDEAPPTFLSVGESLGGKTLESFAPITPLETINLLKGARSGSPSDPCTVSLINNNPEAFAHLLTPLYNIILESCQYPSAWKAASILPLIKKTTLDPGDPSSYRPISLLPLPAIMLEKLVNSQLNCFLQENSVLDSTQFGFRAGYSTELALLKATEEIREAVDQGGSAILIMLDLSAAFDTVHHEVLMDRLAGAGIRSSAWALLKSFLSNRTQLVELGGDRSKPFVLPCGVPQGSSLSPTLFNVYVSPLATLIRSFGFNLMTLKLCCPLSETINPMWL